MSWKIEKSNDTEIKFINEKINLFNRSHFSFKQGELIDIDYNIKDDTGTLIAGVNLVLYLWSVLYIDILFVEEKYRGQKIGTLLLNKVESMAKAQGASLVHLDNFDWQAKDFYLKHGYEVFGVLENCPTGHQRIYMKKTL